jgi:hypothetical protein
VLCIRILNYRVLRVVPGQTPTFRHNTPVIAYTMNASSSTVINVSVGPFESNEPTILTSLLLQMMDYDQQLSQLLSNMTLQNAWNVAPSSVSLHNVPLRRMLIGSLPGERQTTNEAHLTTRAQHRTRSCPTAQTQRTTQHVPPPPSSSRPH